MARFLLTTLVALALASSALARLEPRKRVVFATKPFSSKKIISSATSTALSLPRGGGGGGLLLQPETAVKLNSIIALTCGTQFWISPEFSLKQYGCTPSAGANFMMRRLGSCLLSFGMIGFCTVWKGWAIETAITMVSLYWLVELARTFMDNDPTKVGFKASSQYPPILVSLAVVFANLSGADWAPVANLASAAMFFAYGPTSILAKDMVLDKILGFKNPDATTGVMLKAVGGRAMGVSIAMVSMLRGWYDPITSYAIALPFAGILCETLISPLVTGEGPAVGMAPISIYFWIVFNLYIVACVGLGK